MKSAEGLPPVVGRVSRTVGGLRRAANFGLKVLKTNASRPDTPLKLNFAVTYLCQYRCKTCNIWQKRPTDELSTDEILELIRRNRGFSWVDVTGGEIFLRRDIEEILLAMAVTWKDLALLHFPTNGYQTSKIVPIVERLAPRLPAKLVVTVSLDGDEELNDEIRGVRGGYRHQMETFAALRRVPGVRAVLGMTLSRANLGKFEATFESCYRDCPGLGIEDFHLNVMQMSGHYYANDDKGDLLPAEEQARREIDAYRRRRGRTWVPSAWLENRYLNHLDRFLQTGVTPMRCHALRSSCFIDPWGVVFPCITYSRPLGRLRETGMDLAPIWNNPDTERVQREIWGSQCPHCWTACEAYPSILGNLLRPGDHPPFARQDTPRTSLPVVD